MAIQSLKEGKGRLGGMILNKNIAYVIKDLTHRKIFIMVI